MRRSTVLITALLLFLMSVPVSAAITHRWDFTVDANDVVGGLPSTMYGTAAVSGGSLLLDGTADCYLALPGPSINIPSYSAVTIEQWITSATTNTGFTMTFVTGELGNPGMYYLDMQPTRNAATVDGCRFTITNTQYSTEATSVTSQMNDGIEHHLVGVCDGTHIQLYVDGVAMPAMALTTQSLAAVSNQSCYLGRSVYTGDGWFVGSINETRIYDKVLSPAEVLYTNHFGPSGPDNDKLLVIRSTNPAYGQTMVSATPTLSWTLEPGITADSYNLYIGKDPNIADPNRSDVSAISDLVKPGLTANSYTVLTGEKLLNNRAYYWRVDTVSGATTYQGVGQTFTTIPAFPAFTVQPGTSGAFKLGSAPLTATCESVTALTDVVRWYKVGTPDVEITTADPEVSIVQNTVGALTTSTLTINNVTVGREGNYYAKATNIGGTGTSANGTVVVKRLLAQYEFENNTNDSSENGLHGTVKTPSGAPATIAYAASVNTGMGQAISMTGTGISNPSNAVDPYVDLPDGFSNFSQGITISAWVNPLAQTNWARIVQFGNGTNGANNSFYFTRVGTGTTLRFENDNTSPNNATSVTTGNNGITMNAWQHLVVTVNTNATNNAVIYRNGVVAQRGTITLPNVVTRTNCFIGRSEWYGDNLFRGLMDDLQIYNYGLTADEVAALYSDVMGPFCQIRPTYDYNNDCLFNMSDFAVFAAQWLDCGLYPADDC